MAQPGFWRAARAAAAARLLAAAERLNASLIVLGALGRSLQPRSELGSTAERVRTSSSVPVLLVP